MSNNFDKQYLDLLRDILDNGVTKETRNGGTLSVFGRQIRHKMSDGFPAITTKKLHFKGVVSELLWLLNGRTDLRYLLEHNNFIWVGDAYKKYEQSIRFGKKMQSSISDIDEIKLLTEKEFIDKIKTDDEFNKEFGDFGPLYGHQWRNWGGYTEKFQQTTSYGGSFGGPTHIEYGDIIENKVSGIDQIAEVIHKLKTNPDDRGIIVSAWNVSDLADMTLRPCHNFFQFYTRELSQEERWSIRYNYYPKDKQFPWDRMALPPHDFLDKFNIPRRTISLMWNQRSQDVPLGGPYNWASYSLLLEIIAKTVNMVSDELIITIGDAHIYLNQIDGVKEQLGRDLTDEERYNIWFNNNYETGMERFYDPNNLPDYDNPYYEPTPKRTREPYPLPTLKHMKSDEFYKSLGEDLSLLSHLTVDDFVLENYKSHSKIYFPLSN